MRLYTSSIALASCLAFTSPGLAQRGAPGAQPFTVGEIATGSCWIDAATGARVETYPAGFKPGLDDPNHFYRPGTSDGTVTGKNFARASDGSWIDAATGVRVNSYPAGFQPGLDDPNHFYRPGTSDGTVPGKSFAKIPCPPPPQSTGLQTTPSTSWTGGYLGGELVKNWGRVRSTETLAATGAITNQFSDSGDPFGLGLVAGYNFTPWNTNFVIGPFASADWMRQTINHNFAGGQFLGSTTNWIFTVGGKAGVVATPGLLLYGLAGAAFLNQNLNVNFVTAASNNTTTPGFTLGVGGEYQPQSWMLAGSPVSVFGQYQHTWWSTANFNTPASSPAFNYSFRRQDDTIKLGVLIHFSPQLPAPVVSKY